MRLYPIHDKALRCPKIIGGEEKPVGRPFRHYAIGLWERGIGDENSGVKPTARIKKEVNGIWRGAGESTKMRGDEMRSQAGNSLQ